MFHVVAKYGAKQGQEGEVLAFLAELADKTRKESGNVSYEVFRSVDEQGQILILESYHGAEDFDRHRESQHFLSLGAGEVIPRLETRHVWTYTSEDVPLEAP